MARTVLTLLIFSALLVLTSLAEPAPNLERTLAVQYGLVDQQPYDAEAHNDLGNLLLLTGRDVEAEQAYRRAVELEPEGTAARFNLAILLQQSGRNDEAAKELQSLLKIDAYHGWAHYQLGIFYDQKRDRSRALESYARAFAYDPALTFASNNPHIIDNELSTEALLLSQRYRSSAAARVPRHYSNPQRIAELMLHEDNEPEEDETDAETAEDDEDDGVPTSRAGRSQDSRPDSQTLQRSSSGGGSADLEIDANPPRPRPREGSAEADQGGDDSVDSSGLVVASPQERVLLTPESVDEVGRRNQAAPPPPPRPGSRDARRQAFEQRFLAGRDRNNSRNSATEEEASSASPTRTERAPAAAPRRYRPGRASTGRLELDFLPKEPAERHAALRATRG